MKQKVNFKLNFYTIPILLLVFLSIITYTSCQKRNTAEPDSANSVEDDKDKETSKKCITTNEIKSIEEFLAITSGTADQINCYVLATDLNFENQEIEKPLFDEVIEYIDLDGRDRAILNLRIKTIKYFNGVGIFSSLLNSTIKNLKISNVQISTVNARGIAILIGKIPCSSVELSKIEISNSKIQSTTNVGGLIGEIENTKTCNNVKTVIDHITVIDTHIEGTLQVGGIVGKIEGTFGEIQVLNSKSSGTIVSRNGNHTTFGGIVGLCIDNATVSNCQSSMTIDGSGSTNSAEQVVSVGGIIGQVIGTPSIKNNTANNEKIICNNNDKNTWWCGRVIGWIGHQNQPNIENNHANSNIKMLLKDKKTEIQEQDLNANEIGHNKKHGQTVTE